MQYKKQGTDCRCVHTAWERCSNNWLQLTLPYTVKFQFCIRMSTCLKNTTAFWSYFKCHTFLHRFVLIPWNAISQCPAHLQGWNLNLFLLFIPCPCVCPPTPFFSQHLTWSRAAFSSFHQAATTGSGVVDQNKWHLHKAMLKHSVICCAIRDLFIF